ncbi:MAG TPA: DUF695 domain-containing protein, partial [Myxococcaceae bacterium]|nr:DUF695 domain-containing protein [Myxococcaceae bacterium]
RAVEDELIAILNETNAISYGRLIHDGALRVLFYATHRESTEAVLQKWVIAHPDHKIALDWKQDPEWEIFSRF